MLFIKRCVMRKGGWRCRGETVIGSAPRGEMVIDFQTWDVTQPQTVLPLSSGSLSQFPQGQCIPSRISRLAIPKLTKAQDTLPALSLFTCSLVRTSTPPLPNKDSRVQKLREYRTRRVMTRSSPGECNTLLVRPAHSPCLLSPSPSQAGRAQSSSPMPS